MANTLPSLAPVLVHHRKTSQSYKYLCTNLASLNPATKNLLAFGTDDETALVEAFEETFDCAVHLLCERHMQNTLKAKFKALSVSLTQRPQPAEGAKNPILDRLLQEGVDWIPLSTLTGMTEKAEKILQVPDQVIPIPNSEGSLLIPSKTNASEPTRRKRVQYRPNCLQLRKQRKSVYLLALHRLCRVPKSTA